MACGVSGHGRRRNLIGNKRAASNPLLKDLKALARTINFHFQINTEASIGFPSKTKNWWRWMVLCNFNAVLWWDWSDSAEKKLCSLTQNLKIPAIPNRIKSELNAKRSAVATGFYHRIWTAKKKLAAGQRIVDFAEAAAAIPSAQPLNAKSHTPQYCRNWLAKEGRLKIWQTSTRLLLMNLCIPTLPLEDIMRGMSAYSSLMCTILE
jgi:hypothetical protein